MGNFSQTAYYAVYNLCPRPDKFQKGCRRGSRGTKDQLLIDKTVLRDCKRRHTIIYSNLAMAWVDYRKAYDFVSHSWIKECLKLFGAAENERKLNKHGKLEACFPIKRRGLERCAC